MDDYYLNLLSWGSNNVIAIALNQAVYLWHANDGHIDQLLSLEGADDYVSSVKWCTKESNMIAIGTSNNTVQLWDSSRLTMVRELEGHTARISALSWNGSNTLSSGGRDSTILNHDIRQSRHIQSTYLGHQQEVCGLEWSLDGTTLASGGNENMLCIWDAAMSGNSRQSLDGSNTLSSRLSLSSHSPRYRIMQHQAAVKALAWCPFQRNTLASGGGTADRTIRLWNTSSGVNLSTTDTGSQVCALQWSDTYRELVSSHGFSDNQLCLWKYNSASNADALVKMKEFRGHTARVLHMARSPDGTQIVTAGADESLRFWDMFSPSTGSGRRSSIGTPNSKKLGENSTGCEIWSPNTGGFSSKTFECAFSIR